MELALPAPEGPIELALQAPLGAEAAGARGRTGEGAASCADCPGWPPNRERRTVPPLPVFVGPVGVVRGVPGGGVGVQLGRGLPTLTGVYPIGLWAGLSFG